MKVLSENTRRVINEEISTVKASIAKIDAEIANLQKDIAYLGSKKTKLNEILDELTTDKDLETDDNK